MTRILQERVLTDTEIEETISKANESLHKLETSTRRIQNALHHPVQDRTRRKIRRLSDRMAGLALLCVVGIIITFTSIFLKTIEMRDVEIKNLSARVSILETASKVVPTQPSHNLAK